MMWAGVCPLKSVAILLATTVLCSQASAQALGPGPFQPLTQGEGIIIDAACAFNILSRCVMTASSVADSSKSGRRTGCSGMTSGDLGILQVPPSTSRGSSGVQIHPACLLLSAVFLRRIGAGQTADASCQQGLLSCLGFNASTNPVCATSSCTGSPRALRYCALKG